MTPTSQLGSFAWTGYPNDAIWDHLAGRHFWIVDYVRDSRGVLGSFKKQDMVTSEGE